MPRPSRSRYLCLHRLCYAKTTSIACRAAAVAIAGPVRDGRGTLTNLDWSMDEETLARDRQAQRTVCGPERSSGSGLCPGAAIATRQPDSLVIEGAPDLARRRSPSGDRRRHRVQCRTCPSCTRSAASSPPRNAAISRCRCAHADDLCLSEFLADEARIHLGRGCSFGARRGPYPFDWLAHEAAAHSERSGRLADIMDRAMRGGGPDSRTHGRNVYVRLIGTVAGDLALVHLPFGGIYLIGGVARAMSKLLRSDFGFHRTPSATRAVSADFMTRFPVSVIEDDFAALEGLASHLADLEKI